MPAYAVSMVTVTNPDKYQEYIKLAGPAVAKYGGKFIARGGNTTVMEGEFGYNRLVVCEFPSAERAKEFYDSPEYTEARSKRKDAANFNMVIVDGV